MTVLGLVVVVHQVAVGLMLKLVAEGIAPVVKYLPAVDVASHAPGVLVTLGREMRIANDQVIPVDYFIRAVFNHYLPIGDQCKGMMIGVICSQPAMHKGGDHVVFVLRIIAVGYLESKDIAIEGQLRGEIWPLKHYVTDLDQMRWSRLAGLAA